MYSFRKFNLNGRQIVWHLLNGGEKKKIIVNANIYRIIIWTTIESLTQKCVGLVQKVSVQCDFKEISDSGRVFRQILHSSNEEKCLYVFLI